MTRNLSTIQAAHYKASILATHCKASNMAVYYKAEMLKQISIQIIRLIHRKIIRHIIRLII